MKANRNHAIFVITIGTIFAALVVVSLVFTNIGIYRDRIFLEILIDSLLVISAGVFALSLFAYFTNSALVKNLQAENEYILGKKSDFNNAYAFQKRAARIAKYRQKQSQHVIAFTFSNLVISQNVNRNFEIFKLNSHIVDYLNEYGEVVKFEYTYDYFEVSNKKANEDEELKINGYLG